MGRKIPVYSPREAMALATRLGWTVKHREGSGAIKFKTKVGNTFTCAAPGRTDRVPLRLARALYEAVQSKQG